MKTRLIALGLLGILAFWACSTPKPTPKLPPPLPEGPLKVVPPAYYIVPQDVLEIQVMQEPALSRDFIVRPDGKIAMPLIGDILAMGSTLTQLDEEITKQLSEYVRTPDISVAIKTFGGEKIIIMGAVKTPGIHKFRGHTRLTEAIALAGGPTGAAKLKTVLVIRGDITQKPEVLVINVKDMLTKGDLSRNIAMQPKDIVYLPTTFISDFTAFIRNTLTPTLSTIITLDYFKTRLED